MKLLLVGNQGGTNVGESFRRAAEALAMEVRYCRVADAFDAPALARIVSWRLLGRRPPRLRSFSRAVLEVAQSFRPDLLLATGTAPLTRDVLDAVRALGTVTANYLTDDPWNRTVRARWLFRSIGGYDFIFSPRKSNLSDLSALGPTVEYLPFAYDPDLFYPETAPEVRYDVMFAGGADADRVPFIAALLDSGVRVGLFGDYWSRFAATRAHDGGWLPLAELRRTIAASRVAVCLVRRANRDGHTMSTFELAAMRACMLVEDTPEHRQILGDTAARFTTPEEMTAELGRLLGDGELRDRMAAAAHARITAGGQTYRDRLSVIVARCISPTQASNLQPPARSES